MQAPVLGTPPDRRRNGGLTSLLDGANQAEAAIKLPKCNLASPSEQRRAKNRGREREGRASQEVPCRLLPCIHSPHCRPGLRTRLPHPCAWYARDHRNR